ncbi:hypothetical protein XIS1_1370033 [Xenorhabdus innexi]|uniref:Uncharacterized protein n=1 Tax=Xenorhabdus innexi TaxID=290109 RepID=A0A1N6MTN4_9GAMM|nr:hypothetical protein XIS1_1370033 [Xenorhabdus innexi]
MIYSIRTSKYLKPNAFYSFPYMFQLVSIRDMPLPMAVL